MAVIMTAIPAEPEPPQNFRVRRKDMVIKMGKRKASRTDTPAGQAASAGAALTRPPQAAGEAPLKLKLLVTVVNRGKSEFYVDYLQSNFRINLQTVLAAEGTADSETLRLLGLADSPKCVILSIVREDQAHAALQGLDGKFSSIKNGKGIAFTVPLTGTIGVAIYRFLGDITA